MQFLCLGRISLAYLSFFKDTAYGTLDVFTKGGLALYVAVRAMDTAD